MCIYLEIITINHRMHPTYIRNRNSFDLVQSNALGPPFSHGKIVRAILANFRFINLGRRKKPSVKPLGCTWAEQTEHSPRRNWTWCQHDSSWPRSKCKKLVSVKKKSYRRHQEATNLDNLFSNSPSIGQKMMKEKKKRLISNNLPMVF